MFEVLERFQEGATESAGGADGRKPTVGGNIFLSDLVAEQLQAKARSETRWRQEFREHVKAEIAMAVGQDAGEMSLEAQAEQACGHDDGDRSERSAGLLEGDHLSGEVGLQGWLKRAEMDFAWR